MDQGDAGNSNGPAATGVDGFRIVRTGPENAEAIALVNNAAFAPFYRVPAVYRSRPVDPDEVRTWFEDRDDYILIAFVPEGVVGYCHLRRSSADEVGFVSHVEHAGQSKIAVHPAYRHRGIGRELVSHAVHLAGGPRPFWIWAGVWSDNTEGTAFLEALGLKSGPLDEPCPFTVQPQRTDESVLAVYDLSGPAPDVPSVTGLVIREVRESDGEDLRSVFGESRHRVFGPEPTEADIRQWMTSGWAELILVAEYDGRVVGSMEFRPWGVLGVAGVRPRFRRHGIGAALLAATLAEMKRRGHPHALADTGWFDGDAIRLFERLGFDTSRWLRSYMKHFRIQPRRTGISDLTNDELVLLDVLVDCSVALSGLTAGTLDISFNLGHDHAIPAEDLATTVEWLEEQGLVELSRDSRSGDNPTVQLTAAGFALWESERAPPWDRFVRVTGLLRMEGPRTTLRVISPNRDLAEKVYGIYRESTMVARTLGEVEISGWRTADFCGWKEIPGCTEFCVEVEEGRSHRRWEPRMIRPERDWWTVPADLAYPPFV